MLGYSGLSYTTTNSSQPKPSHHISSASSSYQATRPTTLSSNGTPKPHSSEHQYSQYSPHSIPTDFGHQETTTTYPVGPKGSSAFGPSSLSSPSSRGAFSPDENDSAGPSSYIPSHGKSFILQRIERLYGSDALTSGLVSTRKSAPVGAHQAWSYNVSNKNSNGTNTNGGVRSYSSSVTKERVIPIQLEGTGKSSLSNGSSSIHHTVSKSSSPRSREDKIIGTRNIITSSSSNSHKNSNVVQLIQHEDTAVSHGKEIVHPIRVEHNKPSSRIDRQENSNVNMGQKLSSYYVKEDEDEEQKTNEDSGLDLSAVEYANSGGSDNANLLKQTTTHELSSTSGTAQKIFPDDSGVGIEEEDENLIKNVPSLYSDYKSKSGGVGSSDQEFETVSPREDDNMGLLSNYNLDSRQNVTKTSEKVFTAGSFETEDQTDDATTAGQSVKVANNFDAQECRLDMGKNTQVNVEDKENSAHSLGAPVTFKGMEKDGYYFLNEMNKARAKIEGLIAKSSVELEDMDPNEEQSGLVRAAIGKANLLNRKKFKQFEELCRTNIVSSSG